MAKVAFFGHNFNEPAVRKRARLFDLAGFDVIGVMPHRGTPKPADFDLVSLGETRDNYYISRLKPFLKCIAITPRNTPKLKDIDLIYARNLDMLAFAHGYRLRNRLKVPIIYECLDIHNLLVGSGHVASMLRRLEGALLKRSDMLVYSSERYNDAYFAVHHAGVYRSRLVENRLNSTDVTQRPVTPRSHKKGRLKLGWIGNLRCRRSLTLLTQLGKKFSPNLEIYVHGYPARSVFPNFEEELEQADGITYFGPYDGSVDLPNIYDNLDVVWAGDWFEAEGNSVWQIPNRIYEGGYFGVPAIASQRAETGHKIRDWGAGWVFNEPAETTVASLI
jgi:succinoglycan biosynthesis protein ExoL